MKYLCYSIICIALLGSSTASAGMVLSRKTMTYDVFNRMTGWQLEKPDGSGGWTVEKSESHTYRGDLWHRASTTSNGVTTSYLYDGDNVVADLQGGVVVKSYVTPSLDGNVSMTVYDGQANPTYWYNQDERQSVKNLTDSTGAIAQSYDYSAYGDQLRSQVSSLIPNRYTYTGRELNETSGDYYFRYRTYDAGLGGFLSRDPQGYIDGMTKYIGYFSIKLKVDPMGLLTEDQIGHLARKYDKKQPKDTATTPDTPKPKPSDPELKPPSDTPGFSGSICKKAVLKLVNGNDELTKLWKKFKPFGAKEGCPLPFIECACCKNGEVAWYEPDNHKVSICYPEHMDVGTVYHELWHAQQKCAKNFIGNDCLNSLKREIEAYYCEHAKVGSKGYCKKGNFYGCLYDAIGSSCQGNCSTEEMKKHIAELETWFKNNEKDFCKFGQSLK